MDTLNESKESEVSAMWSAQRILKITSTAIAAVALAAGTAAFATPRPEPVLPVPDPIIQAAYESEVADFLASTPKPTPSDFDSTTAGQNSYWQAMAAWYDSVPWYAVAGQWGCEGSQSATFNPPNDAGVITVGYGGVGTCGGFELDYPAILSLPQTRSGALQDNPDLLDQLGR